MSYSTCAWKLLPYQEKRKRGHGSCEEAMAGVSSSSFEIACMGILKFCLVIALSIGEWFLPSSHYHSRVRIENKIHLVSANSIAIENLAIQKNRIVFKNEVQSDVLSVE